MVKDITQDLLSADIQDPTDFAPESSAPGLRALDNALRCKICSELYEAPVSLPCGHCYCSLCLRQQLADKPSCPTCWKETNEGTIRSNPMLEEAVEAWKRSRALVLQLFASDVERRSRPPRTDDYTDARSSKKRKLDINARRASHHETRPAKAGPSSCLERSSLDRRSSSSPDSFSGTQGLSDEDESEPTVRSSSVVEIPPDEPVRCPLCSRRVRVDSINSHIDNGCRDVVVATKQKDAWSKILNGRDKGKLRESRSDADDDHLPKVSYAVLKEKQIRDLLSEHELSTTGDKSTLVARHQRWVFIYNSNVDRRPDSRKRVSELRADLKKWEKEREANAKRPSAKETADQVNATEHRRVNKAQFDALVAQARSNRQPSSTMPSISNTPKGKTVRRGSVQRETDAIVVE